MSDQSMEVQSNVTLPPPQDLLREIAVAMNRSRPDIQTTIPFRTTWREAIKAVEASLGNLDEEFLVFPPGPGSQRRQLREEAQKSPPSDSPLERGVGLPIKSSIDLHSLPRQQLPTEETRQLLRDEARRIAREDFREPFLPLQAITDNYIPTGTRWRHRRYNVRGRGTNNLRYRGELHHSSRGTVTRRFPAVSAGPDT